METNLADKKVNGVNVMGLHDTIKAVRTNAGLGTARFRVRNQWKGQALNTSTIGDFFVAGQEHQHKQTFVFHNDEAEVLLGQDQGANPAEFVLHALAGCVTTTTVYHAAALGINIRKLETELEGDLDLQGLLQIDPSVPTGFQNIRVRMNIESDATGEKLEKLKKLYLFSPVFGTLSRPPKIDFQVIAEG